MGWSFRKSINFGPLRLNLSKSGVGLSTGVKGFRVSTGPRGGRLNAGMGPLRYTKTLWSRRSTRRPPDAADTGWPAAPRARGPWTILLILLLAMAAVVIVALLVVLVMMAASR